MTRHFDILISNGLVVTLDDQDHVIENGVVAIVGDCIADVGSAAQFSDCNASKKIDARGGVVMPGLINTHTHASMTCFRGLADDLDLMTWLHDYIFPAETKMTYEKVHAGALLACTEMILSGTTCFSDMYLFEDAVAEAAHAAGMRAVVGEVLYDFDSPNYGPIDRGFEYTRFLIEKWKDHPRVSIAVEPHSPYLCAPKLLEMASEFSYKYQIPLIIHLAETDAEVTQIQQKYGRTPVAHLAHIGVLSSRVVGCHCVALTEEDIELLKIHDVKVSHNPESNMKLASGIAPVPKLLNTGICVGLGTDGPTSNNNLDMFAEMDTAAKIHKLNTLDPTVMDARTVLRMATCEAAKALGLEKITGSLEKGKKADVIILDTHRPHWVPMYHVYSHLVYCASGHDVTTSIINGNLVMEQGRLLTLDMEKILADVNQIAYTIQTNKR